MAAHSTFALNAVAAARAGDPPRDPKLGALYGFALSLGAEEGSRDARRDAGATRRRLLEGALFEVVAQVGHTTLANFAHSISNAPVDAAFAPQAWAAAV